MNEYPGCPYIVPGSIAAYEGVVLSWTCGLYRRMVNMDLCEECNLIQTRTAMYEPVVR